MDIDNEHFNTQIPRRKYISFDIELYNDLEEDESGKTLYGNLIPSIAAFTTDGEKVEFYYDEPHISPETCSKVADDMLELISVGYTPLAWNGVSFDFRVMGVYSGEVEKYSKIALSSIDPMLLVTFKKGYFLGLDKALVGAGLESKTHAVTLNNGETIFDMEGAKAPQMWRDGEIEAVKEYLSGDVIQPYKLARLLEENPTIKWTSNNGKSMSCPAPLVQVASLYNWPVVYNGWMDNPPTREQFIDWIPEEILEQYFIPECIRRTQLEYEESMEKKRLEKELK